MCRLYRNDYISDITFFPIMYNEKYNILENMAQVLGYDTEVPFPIMYSFLKWWNETKRQLVFIIDDYFNGNSFNKMSTDKVVDFFNFFIYRTRIQIYTIYYLFSR